MLTSLTLKRCASCYKLLSRNCNISRRPNQRYFDQVQKSRPSWCASQYSTDQKDDPKRNSGAEEVEEDDVKAPYTYSTSKAASWDVDKSFGSQYSRPWWKVAPLSIALCAFVSWIFLRKETDLDRKLEVSLNEHLPDLFPATESIPDEEEESPSKNAG